MCIRDSNDTSPENLLATTNYFQRLNDERSFPDALNSPLYVPPPPPAPLKDISSFHPLTPRTQLTHHSPFHNKKDSVISTVSTIPQDENDTPSPEQPHFNILPTIPGSSENTPQKSNPTTTNHYLPQKHTFQHNTPVKQQQRTPIKTSPTRITNKPSTLPRGTIDLYVKELPDKLFECLYEDCGKIFKRRYNVRSHIQTHLEDKPYACDFPGCEKAFVRNHDLVRHKKSHANRTSSPQKRVQKDHSNEGTQSNNTSPVKEAIQRDKDGSIMLKMQDQLRDEMEKYGFLRPPSSAANTNLVLTPSPERVPPSLYSSD